MRKLSLVLLLVACGDDGVRHTPDAPRADGAPDSSVDAAVLPVTLTATYNGQPVAGVHVYFQNADSSVVLATTTDASGAASAVMQPGGYVTAINPYGAQGQDDLETFAGVKPGDHLLLQRALVPESSITVNVQAPSDGALNHTVYSPCNNAGASLSLPAVRSVAAAVPQGQITLSNCGSATDFLVLSNDTGIPTAYLYAANVAVADQGTADLTTGTYAPVTTRTLTYSNLPSAQSLSIEDDVLDPLGIIYIAGTETPADQPSATVQIPEFPGESDLLQTTFNNQTFSQQVLFDWGHLGSAFSTDVGARALQSFTGSPTFDAATHAGTIPLDTAAGGAGDFSLFFMAVTRPAPQHDWQWTIAAPFGATVALPTLPTDVFDYNVGSGDTAAINGWVNGKVPGGYDAVRAFLLATTGPQSLAVGSAGAATFVHSQQPAVLRHRTR